MNSQLSIYEQHLVQCLCVGIIFTLTMGYTIYLNSLVPAIQRSCCLDYYQARDSSRIGPDGSIPESFCKLDPIEHCLASTNGYLETMRYLVELLTILPLGYLAERLGKRPLLFLKTVGQLINLSAIIIICYFRTIPTRLILVTPFMPPISGGFALLKALVYSAAAATTTDRSWIIALHFALDFTIVFCQMVGPIISVQLIKRGVFLPLICGIGVMFLSVLMSAILPDTETRGEDDVTEPLLAESSREFPSPRCNASVGTESQSISILEHFARFHRDTMTLCGCFDGKSQVMYSAFFSFFVAAFGMQCLGVLAQYSWVLYGYTVSQGGYLFAIKGLIGLLFIGAVVWDYARKEGDLSNEGNARAVLIAKTTVVALTCGCFVMALAHKLGVFVIGLIIYASGLGFNTAVRTIIGNYIPDRKWITPLYSILAFGEAFGMLAGSFAVTAAFNLGISLGGLWVGLPFLITGGMYGIAAIAVFHVF